MFENIWLAYLKFYLYLLFKLHFFKFWVKDSCLPCYVVQNVMHADQSSFTFYLWLYSMLSFIGWSIHELEYITLQFFEVGGGHLFTIHMSLWTALMSILKKLSIPKEIQMPFPLVRGMLTCCNQRRLSMIQSLTFTSSESNYIVIACNSWLNTVTIRGFPLEYFPSDVRIFSFSFKEVLIHFH